jgi:hypothetical protein
MSLTGNYSEGRLRSLLPKVAQSTNSASSNCARAGGIVDGHGIAAALTLGASAVQIGTAFLRYSDPVKDSLAKSLAKLEPEAIPIPLRAGADEPQAAVAENDVQRFNEWRPGRDKVPHLLVPSLWPISSGAFGPKPRRFYRERDSGEVPGVA